jgi:hypothetical protein
MLAYCDKIADTIRKALLGYDPDQIIGLVEGTKMDLHPTLGYMMSTKKFINVSDMNGKWYKVTVEEMDFASDDFKV